MMEPIMLNIFSISVQAIFIIPEESNIIIPKKSFLKMKDCTIIRAWFLLFSG